MNPSSENNISINKDGKNVKNKNILENKQKKRRHSLPLKSFKVTSPSESKTLSIVCDNIFEDANIEQANNSSMIQLSLEINIKKNPEEIKNNDINNINEESIKKINIENENKILNNSKAFNNKDNNIILKEDEDDIIGTPVHKKSYIFNNLLKLKMIKCPRLLEEQWKYEKILLDYNIIDFTSKSN